MKAIPIRWDLAAGRAWMYRPNNEFVCTVRKTSLGWVADDRHGCVVTPVPTRKQAMALAEAYYGVQEVSDATQWIPVSQPPAMVDHGGLHYSGDVLITDGKHIHIGWLICDVDDPEFSEPRWSWGEDDEEFSNPTHWATLPALP
jgi:hypothetical protein